jgi:hypothetical protein
MSSFVFKSGKTNDCLNQHQLYDLAKRPVIKGLNEALESNDKRSKLSWIGEETAVTYFKYNIPAFSWRQKTAKQSETQEKLYHFLYLEMSANCHVLCP